MVWEAQTEAAAQHLSKGQAVSFAGPFEPREYVTNAGDRRITLEVHDVAIEYGAKPRGTTPDSQAQAEDPRDDASMTEDIPF